MTKARQVPYLQISDLTKKFGDFTALKDITLDIYESEFICFLGPSGCGKTTLLRAIAGLDIQTFGTVIQADKDVSILPPTERDFGIVFQSYALFPNLSICKNISYGLENSNIPAADVASRVDQLLQMVGLSDQAHKYPAQLSGGQQQRVALARALAISPGLLLLDEPLSALDANVRVMLRHEIKELQRKLEVTTVMVTHDQEEALSMADRIVVMNQGVIEQVGTPYDIYSYPETKFVADFIGSMNFLSAVSLGGNRVQIGNLELECGSINLDKGVTITASIRPEDIVVEGGSTGFFAKIEHMEFLGSFVRAILSSEDMQGEQFRADFSANLIRREKLSEGMMLNVRMPKESIRIYTS